METLCEYGVCNVDSSDKSGDTPLMIFDYWRCDLQHCLKGAHMERPFLGTSACVLHVLGLEIGRNSGVGNVGGRGPIREVTAWFRDSCSVDESQRKIFPSSHTLGHYDACLCFCSDIRWSSSFSINRAPVPPRHRITPMGIERQSILDESTQVIVLSLHTSE
ncbi:hypothetical protein BJY00DRAFT_275550 [Aspergillus carlsbadensis]|nr:hypothetical protein BJY00DRAFT_275550 [Aspergillus carlsbadensis]